MSVEAVKRAAVAAVRRPLLDQPSASAVRTTGRRLAATVSAIAEDITGGHS